MKKLLLLLSVVLVITTGCMDIPNPEEILGDIQNPYKEYKIKSSSVAKYLEENIGKAEIEKYGFDTAITSAHVISMTELDDYYKGTIRVIGKLSETKMADIKEANVRLRSEEGIISYDCEFEYSDKTEFMIWASDYIDPLN